MSFAAIASVYDRFNDLTAYQSWLTFTLGQAGHNHQIVLDLACGTGYFSRLLAEHYPQVLGIDLDPAMIEMAQADGLSDNLTFQVGDMLALETLEQTFDLVTCYADSLCFLPDQMSLGQAFRSVYQVLNHQGLFLFDVWTPYQVCQGFEGFAYHDEDEDGALLWTAFPQPTDLAVVHELTVFDRVGLSFDRHQVDLEERTYPLEAYYQLLSQAGFDLNQVQVWVDFGAKPYDASLDSTADRWFFVCRKGD